MYVYAIHLRHFRSFDDVWVFPRSDVNILVGPNNSGKSTLLRALALMLDPATNPRSPELISRFDYYSLDLSRPVELRTWLKPQAREDTSDGEGLTLDESDEVVLAFFDKFSQWKVEVWAEGNRARFSEGHPRRLVPLTIDPMDTPADVPPHESLLAIRMRAVWNDAEEMADTELSIVDAMDTDVMPLTAKHRELLGFRLVGARRSPLHELSLARRSILAQMLKEAELTRAFRKLLKALDEQKQVLLDEESVKSLFAHLNSLMYPRLTTTLLGGAGSDFTLTFLGGDLWRLRGSTSIATTILEKADPSTSESLPLEYQGDGVQNLLLLLYLLELVRDGARNCIVALEEPEQNLEPALARAVFGGLCSLVRGQPADGRENPERQGTFADSSGQVFVTTHSPALISELRGSESLVVLAEASADEGTGEEGAARESHDDAGEVQSSPRSRQWRAISVCYLPQDCRKKLDQDRDRYATALFARHILIVEGDSEVGFLPVAFRHLTRTKPYRNPYYLGLEIMDGDCKTELPRHAQFLTQYGKTCHLLFDYDGEDEWPGIEELRSRFEGKAQCVTSWPRQDLLSFARGCDLESILAAQVSPDVLFEAIKHAYEDAGHPLERAKWHAACQEIADGRIAALLRRIDVLDLGRVDLSALGAGEADADAERIQRAFLYALLHGPHSCKAVKDMRIIAEVLAEHNAFPPVVENLMERILGAILAPREVNHAEPYLAPGR